MSSVVKPLHELITHLVSSQERLEPYKMTQKQISEIFAWLDHRRRGYIDVSDFYAKFSELTENQLFYVFKFLDTSRKGAFKLEDLEAALCVKSGCNRDQDDSIRSFTNLVRVLKATFHLIQQQKRKCHLTSSTLQQIFNRACLKKKDKIDITDFVILLKEASLQVNEKILIYVKNKFFSKPALTQKQFIQTFSQYIWNEDCGKIETNAKHMLEQKIESTGNYIQNKTAQKIKSTEKINSEIDKILQKYRQPIQTQTHHTHHTHTSDLEEIQEHKQQMQQGKIDLESFLTKPDNRFQSKLFQEFHNSEVTMKYAPRETPKQYAREIPKEYARQTPKEYIREPPKDYGKQYSKDYARENLTIEIPRELRNDYFRTSTEAQQQRYEKILSNSSNVGLNYSPKGNSQSYSEISRRREELRKGSLQRQKIIDDLMNKKKSEYTTINKPGMLYSHNLKIETKFNEHENTFLNGHSYIHRSATPTSKTSQPKINYDNSFIGKLYQNPTIQKQLQFRPASATKASNFYDKAYYNKFDHNSRPDLLQFYRKGTEPSKTHDKENILKKAEEEATKKIEEIQRRAKLKVMEKRSTAGVYNRWLK